MNRTLPKSVFRFVAALLLLTCAVPQTAPAAAPLSVQQPRRQLKPSPQPPPQPPQAQLVNRVLANGLEVIALEDHSVPLVTIELAVKNGSYTEPPELNGLSHLYEHMFFKANRAIANQEEYLRAIGQLGITYNGTTSPRPARICRRRSA